MFHGVGGADYPEAEFESHLLFLAENFSVVGLGAMVESIRSRGQLTNQLALTFDDGLRNNLTAAYPVLKRLSLPATFFVCPELIEKGRWLWNHEARERLETMAIEQRQRFASQHVDLNGSIDVEQIIGWMKTLRLREREAVENEIRTETNAFRPSSEQRRKCDVMSWEELRTLDSGLITIGSHTVNHPILSTLTPQQLRFEIRESRHLLEEKLGRKVDQFCYPNGSHNPEVVEEVREHYRLAVTTQPGFVGVDSDPVQLPRIGISAQPLLSWRMHRPAS